MKNRGNVPTSLVLGMATALTVFLLLFTANVSFAQRNILYHSLEVSYIGLNILDVKTTYMPGGVEVNPIVKSMTRNEFIATKVLTVGSTLVACRFIHKQNPKLAIAILAVDNLAYGYIVFHNYQLYLRLRL